MPPVTILIKSHIKGYTRKDGTLVKEHDDRRRAPVKGKPGNERDMFDPQDVPSGPPAKTDPYGHPTVVGKATDMDDEPGKATEFKFHGMTFTSTNKSGTSMADGTPVREFHEMNDEEDGGADSGMRVWLDGQGRVHADSHGEVKKLRQKTEADAASPEGKWAQAQSDYKAVRKVLDDALNYHGGKNPNWGHVGDAEHIASELFEAAEFLGLKGAVMPKASAKGTEAAASYLEKTTPIRQNLKLLDGYFAGKMGKDQWGHIGSASNVLTTLKDLRQFLTGK